MSEQRLGRLLIVDDEVELMTVLGERLEKAGYDTLGVPSGEEAGRRLGRPGIRPSYHRRHDAWDDRNRIAKGRRWK